MPGVILPGSPPEQTMCQTVKGWKARGLLPEPLGTVSGAPAYDLDAVERWYRKSPPTAGRPQK